MKRKAKAMSGVSYNDETDDVSSKTETDVSSEAVGDLSPPLSPFHGFAPEEIPKPIEVNFHNICIFGTTNHIAIYWLICCLCLKAKKTVKQK